MKQFTGDGVMALFGAPQACSDHADRAVRAALGIVERLEGLNRQLRLQDLPALAVGVGIHTGEVVAGLIGPDKRVEYGVVGEAVNLASRIESLHQGHAGRRAVSKEIAGRIGPDLLGRSAVLRSRAAGGRCRSWKSLGSSGLVIERGWPDTLRPDSELHFVAGEVCAVGSCRTRSA